MILPDVRNEQVTGLSIEMKLVRIADPVRPYLRFGSNLDVRELLFGYPKEKHKAVSLLRRQMGYHFGTT